MINFRWWNLLMTTCFVFMFCLFVGVHMEAIKQINGKIAMNTLAVMHCSTALSALVANKAGPVKFDLGEIHLCNMPQYTNNFIHSVRFEEVKK